jgi:hypothetical protein
MHLLGMMGCPCSRYLSLQVPEYPGDVADPQPLAFFGLIPPHMPLPRIEYIPHSTIMQNTRLRQEHPQRILLILILEMHHDEAVGVADLDLEIGVVAVGDWTVGCWLALIANKSTGEGAMGSGRTGSCTCWTCTKGSLTLIRTAGSVSFCAAGPFSALCDGFSSNRIIVLCGLGNLMVWESITSLSAY